MNRMPLSRVCNVTLPRPGVEPGSPRPQRGILTTILPWREIAVEHSITKSLYKPHLIMKQKRKKLFPDRESNPGRRGENAES